MTSDYNYNANNNASRIDNELDELSSGHWKIPLVERDYRSFWGHSKSIVHLFKTLKPIRKEDREELWNRYSEICAETKRQKNEEIQERLCTSERHKRGILHEVSSARVNTLFGFDPPDIQEMKRLSQVLKDARRMLTEYKGEMLGGHKQECFNEIQDVQETHNAWWNDLRKHKDEKHREFLARVRRNIEKNNEKIRKAYSALDSCNRNADELRDKISSSWNDNWADRASGWLSDLENKISDIEDSIRRMEGWIREDEQKLQ
jgi:hypothetical protein